MGTSASPRGFGAVHTFYSPSTWIEGDAVRQLHDVAATAGVQAVAGMPDLHPGKYGPVGCAILSERVHPAWVGSDIGCGMALFALDIELRKLRLDKAAERLRVLQGPWDGDIAGARDAADLPASTFDDALGTIGGGNHFCEVQAIEDVLVPTEGLDRGRAFLLVHSGSRGLGHDVLQRVLASGLAAFDPSASDGRGYLADHDRAVRWAVLNRRLIATRAAEALRADLTMIADLPHNFAEVRPDGVLHRKGAAASDRGLVPIPGSRGTLSYLVEPLRPAPLGALDSLAHGAGRKYDRASMIGRTGRNRSEREALERNPFGGVVVCEDRTTLIEEAPQAYKSIAQVLDDLVAFGLVRVVATFRPLVTFKKAVEEDTSRARERIADSLERRERRREKGR